jgi:hypothetical protein
MPQAHKSFNKGDVFVNKVTHFLLFIKKPMILSPGFLINAGFISLF